MTTERIYEKGSALSTEEPAGPSANRGVRRARRELLAGAVGAVGVIAAETMASGTPAQAANGNPVVQGADNGPTTSATMVFTTSNSELASLADPNTSGKGSLGVYGHGQDVGVLGEGAGTLGTGVVGNGGTNGDGVHGNGNFIANGVVGTGGSRGGSGVLGNGGGGNGTGVGGTGSGTGTGVVGTAGAHGGRGGEFFGSGTSQGVVAVGGRSDGVGVEGDGQGIGSGVVGFGGQKSGSGVAGFGGFPSGIGVVGSGSLPNGTGVQGTAYGTGDGVLGVVGLPSSTGSSGVHGRATTAAGTGVLAENTAGGIALKASGAAFFSRSGVLTVRARQSTVTKSGVHLTAASLILATLQQNRAGVFVQAAVPNVSGDSFTIHLNKAVSASTKVAWFVVN